MALEQQNKTPLGILRGPQVLSLYLLGLLAVFVGERLIGDATTRYVFGLAGSACVLAASLTWVLAWARSQGNAKKIEGLGALFSLGGLVALAVYLVGTDLILGPASVVKSDKGGVGIHSVLAAAWPIIMACTVLPLIFVQWSAASMASGRGVEVGRVLASARSATVISTLLCTLFLVNAIADRQDIHTDLSYFKTTSPSESSRSLVEGMDTDTQALLFFPSPNEVLAEILPYFQELDKQSARFEVKVVDRALELDLSQEHRVSKDGTVVLVRGKSRQKIELGEKLDRAKRKLRTLDAEFQKALMKLTHERRTIYMVTGHGERGADRVEGDIRSRISTLKQFLSASNFTVNNLGAIEGLTSEVPNDAAMVVWADPTSPLFPGEADALKAYLEGGGRMLVTLDPDSQAGIDDFLAYLGVSFKPAKLAHDKAFVPLDQSKANHYNLVTNAFSSHPSVTTVSRHRRRMPVLFPKTGYLEKAAGTKRRVTFTVRSLSNTWADENGDTQRAKEEKLSTFQLAAAVSAKIKPKKHGSPDPGGKEEPAPGSDKSKLKGLKAKDGSEKKKAKAKPDLAQEMRVVVLADSDVFADDYIGFRVGASGHPANFQLLADVLTWLVGEGQVGGIPESEEDQKIVHTKEKDVYWFYATVFAPPLLIFGLGVGTRWGRGRKRRAG